MWWDRAAEYSEHWATGVSTWWQMKMKRRVSSVGDRTGHDVEDKDPTMVTKKRMNQGRGLLQWVGVQKGERGDFDKTWFWHARRVSIFKRLRLWHEGLTMREKLFEWALVLCEDLLTKLTPEVSQSQMAAQDYVPFLSWTCVYRHPGCIIWLMREGCPETGEWKTLTVNNQQSCTPYTLINPQNPLECAWHMCLYVWYAMCHENCGVFWLVCACTCAGLPWWSFKSTMSRLKNSQFTGNVFHTQIYQHICNTGYTHSTSHTAGFTFSYFHYNLSPFC